MRNELITVLFLLFLSADFSHGAENEPPLNTQPETTPLLTAADALQAIALPEGFRATLFASEPVIAQPIGIATDTRGRLWVAENYSYAEAAVGFDNAGRDRIVILEDADHDGQAERHTVFWDRGRRLTSVELGNGGVWALSPPQLLFIPDRDGNDVPDGPPEVVLDGFNDQEVRHNIANGLRWGPDGWLYGRQGILVTSLVGRPGAPPSERVPTSCSIWRYHPTRKIYEVYCRGTTNSWGMDWDEFGEPFFINTVIGHLWHALPGAHYRRMYGEDDNPHTYQLIEQTADHFHWDTAEAWHDIRQIGVSPTTDLAGGGHAHSGLMIYQGENWPSRYRGTLFTINFHGRRLNNDTLARQGAGYVARHAADFMKTSDPWFRGLDLITGADGGVYVADWSDIGECHDNDGIHRSSGRIYKIVYGTPARPTIEDVAKLSDDELVAAQFRPNEWLGRQARRVLTNRHADGGAPQSLRDVLRDKLANASESQQRVRALWCLNLLGEASEELLFKQLEQPNEHVRAWAVRLLIDKAPSPQAVGHLTARALTEPSGLVLVYMAAALQRIDPRHRLLLGQALARRGEFADDPVFPLMLWYGLEPTVPEDPRMAVVTATMSRVPLVTQFIARRLTENLRALPEPVDLLVAMAHSEKHVERSRAILTGMSEALRGWRQAPMPGPWKRLQASAVATSDPQIERLVRDLSVVFGDGRALDSLRAIAADHDADPAGRRDALRVLVEARAEGLVPLLQKMADERDLGADAVNAMATFDDPSTPGFLLRSYPKFKEPARAATIVTLATRPAWARELLNAVAAGTIDRGQVPAFQVRQMSGFPNEALRKQVAELWPELRAVPAAKRERIAQLKQALPVNELPAADLSRGRAQFVKACATCHTLFGQGAKIGPDLTGAQRVNLDYLLENIVDPAATVTPGYRLSSVTLADGRLLSGIVSDQAGETIALQTPTEKIVLNRQDVEEIQGSNQSLMPEGLLDTLTPQQLRDLVAYLMAPQQVPLPQ